MTSDTPDPADGRIERDADGAPMRHAARGCDGPRGGDPAAATTPDLVLDGLLEGQAYLHSLGITAWQDAIVESDSADWTGLRARTSRPPTQGALTARVVGALWWDRHRGLEQIDDLLALRERGATGRFAATSVKIMQDGVCENFTAAVLDPYLDADGDATEQPRDLLRRSGAPARRRSPGWTRWGSRSTSTRWRNEPSGKRSTRSRPPATRTG